jgi:hypothetical protein
MPSPTLPDHGVGFIMGDMAGEPVFYPLVLARSRELAAVFASLETALSRLESTIKDPALLKVFQTIKSLGRKIGRSFIALRDLIANHPATREAEYVARFYFMNFSTISENTRAAEHIIRYVVARPLWLAKHSSRIVDALKSLYADLVSLEIECRERFRLTHSEELKFDFAFREGEMRDWGFGVMAIEEAFRLLGLPLEARHEEVKSAFRRLAKLYHPDINPETDREYFIRLEQAYRRALAAAGGGAR